MTYNEVFYDWQLYLIFFIVLAAIILLAWKFKNRNISLEDDKEVEEIDIKNNEIKFNKNNSEELQ